MTEPQADAPKGADPRRKKPDQGLWTFLDRHSEGFFWIAFWLVMIVPIALGVRAVLTNITDDRQDRRQKFETCVDAGGTFVSGSCVVPQR